MAKDGRVGPDLDDEGIVQDAGWATQNVSISEPRLLLEIPDSGIGSDPGAIPTSASLRWPGERNRPPPFASPA